MKLAVVSRSGRELVAGGVVVADGATADDLKRGVPQGEGAVAPTRSEGPGSSPSRRRGLEDQGRAADARQDPFPRTTG